MAKLAGEDLLVPSRRDAQAFQERAPGYEAGWRDRWHRGVIAGSVDLALGFIGSPRRVLDVGCGTGLLLRELAPRLPDADQLSGIDAAAGMIERAVAAAADERLGYQQGTAEQLPYPDRAFDLVISTTSFDHWADQAAGLAQCRRVLAPGGLFVLTDLFSLGLLPTLVGSRRDRARTPLRATKLLVEAGFRSVAWHRLDSVIIRSVTAT